MRYRILMLPPGEKDGVDAEGRSLGDDWPIADFGVAELPDGTQRQIWITTDRVRLSEVDRNALDEARVCLAALNGDYNPKRHAWIWDLDERGIPGLVYCADCGALAAFDGIDANCEVDGFNCPPTLFDLSDHNV